MPTEGYMRRDEFYTRSPDGDLANEWVVGTLRGVIYTEKIGRRTSSDTFICMAPWVEQDRICACRWRMRYDRGVRQKEVAYGQMDELQLDTMALQRGMFEMDILRFPDNEERVGGNMRQIRQIDERWEILRTWEGMCKRNL